jgi:hypothetical protein
MLHTLQVVFKDFSKDSRRLGLPPERQPLKMPPEEKAQCLGKTTFMGPSIGGGGSNKGVEDRLDRLHSAHRMAIFISIVAVLISGVALVVAVLAWQRPVAPRAFEETSNQPTRTPSAPAASAATPTNTPPSP